MHMPDLQSVSVSDFLVVFAVPVFKNGVDFLHGNRCHCNYKSPLSSLLTNDVSSRISRSHFLVTK